MRKRATRLYNASLSSAEPIGEKYDEVDVVRREWKRAEAIEEERN